MGPESRYGLRVIGETDSRVLTKPLDAALPTDGNDISTALILNELRRIAFEGSGGQVISDAYPLESPAQPLDVIRIRIASRMIMCLSVDSVGCSHHPCSARKLNRSLSTSMVQGVAICACKGISSKPPFIERRRIIRHW